MGSKKKISTHDSNEIELNLIVVDKENLLRYLKQQGKEEVAETKLTYFRREDDKSFYVRIEEIQNQQGEKSKTLTAKGNFKSDNKINRRTETSLPIYGNIQPYIDFLLLTGLEQRDTKEKVRHSFSIGELVVTLDEWSDDELGNRLEIEGKDGEQVEEFATKIIQFCQRPELPTLP